MQNLRSKKSVGCQVEIEHHSVQKKLFKHPDFDVKSLLSRIQFPEYDPNAPLATKTKIHPISIIKAAISHGYKPRNQIQMTKQIPGFGVNQTKISYFQLLKYKNIDGILSRTPFDYILAMDSFLQKYELLSEEPLDQSPELPIYLVRNGFFSGPYMLLEANS